MSLLDTNSDELIAAAEQAPTPIQRKEPTQRFSAWKMLGAAPKGVAAGAAEATGSTADILGAFGQALATTGGSGKGMFATPTPEERKQTNEATDKLLKEGIDYNSEAGRLFRNVSADYTPDPQTAHVAESAVFNLFRVGSKALTSAATMGNIPGAVVAGLEEGFTQSDQLGQQGVDLATRSKVGAVTAVTNAVGFALPAAGKTWLQTGALALAGGPASFIAQNAATREILQAADYSKLADQYDPLDPVGLALSTLLPLGFGALAMRGAKVKPGVEAKGPMPDGTPPPDTAPPKMAPPDDLVDAARVNLVREHMDATNPKPGDLEAADAHSKAYKQAMEQQAAGERVSVADIAPKIDDVQPAKVDAVTNQNDVIGNQGGRSADDTTPGVKLKTGLVDVDGLSRPERVESIRSTAEDFASQLRSKGYQVSIEHSGSVIGPSSYLKVYDPVSGARPDFDLRVSDHSKGARNHQYVANIATQDHLNSFLELMESWRTPQRIKAHEDLKIASDKHHADREAAAIAIRLKSADKKLAKGKPLTNSEQEAVDARSRGEGAPSDARLGYAIATEQAQRGKPSDGSDGNTTTNDPAAPDSGGASNPIADWGAGLTKALDDMAAERAKLQPKPAPAPVDTAQAATKTIAKDGSAPAALRQMSCAASSAKSFTLVS